jgi:hypothetical protein
MDLTITEGERIELRRALFERRDELEKLKKKAEEKGLHGAVTDINQHIQIIEGNGNGEEPGLLARLMDPRTEGAQKTIFDQDIDREVEAGLLDGIEEEAAARVLAAETFRAFSAALPGEAEGDLDDEALLEHIAEAWDGHEFEFEGRQYAGLMQHTTEAGEQVWCYVAGRPEVLFFYDVAAPDEFIPTDAIPTVSGGLILEWAREAYAPEQAEQQTADESAGAELALA